MDEGHVKEQVDIVAENLRLHAAFQESIKSLAKGRLRSRVAVLLLSWQAEPERSLDADAEVERLKATFVNLYNFKVHQKRLSLKKSARQQMNLFLAQFVLEEDGEDTLLITYYAGHGIVDQSGSLVLSGTALDTGHNQKLDQIAWSEAERSLQYTESDMLVIFDCCCAGNLMHTRGWSQRVFEFLGATGMDGMTPMPGPDSFTSALIWALEQLAGIHDGFTTTQLLQKILEAPKFPGWAQTPFLVERGTPSLRRLVIAPLSATAKPSGLSSDLVPMNGSTSPPVRVEQVLLTLQILFGKLPTESNIMQLSTTLKELVSAEDFPAEQVIWKGLEKSDSIRQRDIASVARYAALRWRNTVLERKLKDLSTRLKLSESSMYPGKIQVPDALYDWSSEGLERTDSARHRSDIVTRYTAYKWRNAVFETKLREISKAKEERRYLLACYAAYKWRNAVFERKLKDVLTQLEYWLARKVIYTWRQIVLKRKLKESLTQLKSTRRPGYLLAHKATYQWRNTVLERKLKESSTRLKLTEEHKGWLQLWQDRRSTSDFSWLILAGFILGILLWFASTAYFAFDYCKAVLARPRLW